MAIRSLLEEPDAIIIHCATLEEKESLKMHLQWSFFNHIDYEKLDSYDIEKSPDHFAIAVDQSNQSLYFGEVDSETRETLEEFYSIKTYSDFIRTYFTLH
jgi:hypothetical protein